MRQKMAVFGHEGIGSDPFRVSRDEGVGRFEACPFIFGAKLKRYQKILIHRYQLVDQFRNLTEDFPRKVAAHFLQD